MKVLLKNICGMHILVMNTCHGKNDVVREGCLKMYPRRNLDSLSS